MGYSVVNLIIFRRNLRDGGKVLRFYKHFSMSNRKLKNWGRRNQNNPLNQDAPYPCINNQGGEP
jgi:hypothetical protein